MNEQIKELDVVALLRNDPDNGLVAGQVGTVVDASSEGPYLVEFSDDDGIAYCMAAYHRADLIVLHYEPVLV